MDCLHHSALTLSVQGSDFNSSHEKKEKRKGGETTEGKDICGIACNPSTSEVEAAGSKFKVILNYILSLKLSWDKRAPVSKYPWMLLDQIPT